MPGILKNEYISIDSNTFLFNVTLSNFIQYLEDNQFLPQYKDTGKLLALDSFLNKEYSSLIIDCFLEYYTEKNILPSHEELLNIFLNKVLTKDSFPFKNKEYVMLEKDNTEVKLHCVLSKFYRTYQRLCIYLYNYLSFKTYSQLNIESNLYDYLILGGEKSYNINIFKTDEAGINLFEYENNEDIGDFEFPDEEAYLNIINFIKTRKEDAALGSN